MIENKVVCWFSGGITSAVACKLAIDLYGKENCSVVFMDTKNEDEDTLRFLIDCQKWYEIDIEIITALGDKFKTIQDIWIHYKSLNVATGAICSSVLKRDLRLQFEKGTAFKHQVFGFDINEANRAKSLKNNYPKSKPIFPLLFYALRKEDCITIVQDAGIEPPRAYKLGFHNNNCLKTYCIQGGIGYWQKVEIEDTKAFDKMADMEHYLTDLKGKPVTMLKDQSKEAKESGNFQVFLKPHPDYPNHKCLADMKGRPVDPLMECNGFCGTNDFDERPETEKEINFQLELDL
jgi:hypothetical protein